MYIYTIYNISRTTLYIYKKIFHIKLFAAIPRKSKILFCTIADKIIPILIRSEYYKKYLEIFIKIQVVN